MQLLRANTAVDVLIGPFVDATDGSTAETGLTLDVELSKLGQALANKNDVTTPVHDAAGTVDGHYNCELDATDTNTEGTLVLLAFDSAALIVRHEFMVMAEAAWDSMFVAKDTGFMDVNVKAVSEDESAADNLESACDNYSAERGLTGTALPAVAADAAGGVPISDAGGLDLDAILDGTLVDGVWDEVLTGATHNVTNSSGRRLRQIEASFVVASGTAQAGTANTITLASGESSSDDIFQGDRVVIVGGTGVSEHGIIIAYNGTTKVATMSENWVVTPDNTSDYDLVPADVDVHTWNHATVPDLVGGRIDVSVGAMAANVLTAAALAADAAAAIRDAILPTQNVAFDNIMFLFVAASDHVTPVTGAGTLAVTRSIDGSAFGAGTGTLAEVANGIYQYDASAADMNGGIITFRFTAASGTPGAPDDRFLTIITGGGV